jgi:hypothetical protein
LQSTPLDETRGDWQKDLSLKKLQMVMVLDKGFKGEQQLSVYPS